MAIITIKEGKCQLSALQQEIYNFLTTSTDSYINTCGNIWNELHALMKEDVLVQSGDINLRMHETNVDEMTFLMDNSKKVYKSYLEGDIYSASNEFHHWWFGDKFDPAASYRYKKCFYYIKEGDIFWRIRKSDTNNPQKVFSAKEMYHIPFELRKLASISRFSIPGYPSLYLGNSMYTCWEELRRPSFGTFQCSRFKTNQNLKLLDLRLLKECKSLDEMKEYLTFLPLIIACHKKNQGNGSSLFKEEYVIPQLIAQSIVSGHGKKDNELAGIIYTSTNIDSSIWDINSHGVPSNIVIPIKKNSEKGLCNIIKTYFSVTPAQIIDVPDSEKISFLRLNENKRFSRLK